MQQLFFIKKGKLEWREVKTPRIENGLEALVRPFAVAKCDLDDAFLFHNVSTKIKIGRLLGLVDPKYKEVFGNLLKGPFPFGHECVAEITEVGDQVQHLQAGDVVSVPFQISCGTCFNCQQGHTSVCSGVLPVSTYGFGKHLEFGGAMSDLLKVPYADAMLLKIPDTINPVHLASLSDNIPDAYRHVESLEENKEQSILIISGKAKSVGLYTVLLAKALGAKLVDYADRDQERRTIAKNLGADTIYESFAQIRQQYDIVVDASSNNKGLQAAFKSVRNYGTVTSSGIFIKKPSVSLIEMYAKGVTFKTGFAKARTHAGKVLNLLEQGTLDFDKITTRMGQWDNAIDAFLSDTAKVIVTRPRIQQR